MRPRRAVQIACFALGLTLPLAGLPQDAHGAGREAASRTSPLPYISRNFSHLPRAGQIAAVKAVQDFIRQWEGVLAETYDIDEMPTTSRLRDAATQWAALMSLVENEAWAAGPATHCLYGGWTSSLNARGKCNSPEWGNPHYRDLFIQAGCKAGEFLCSPALFGASTCLPRGKRVGRDAAQTRALIASTYQNCRHQFRGTPEDVVKHLIEDREAFITFQETVLAIEASCEGDAPHPQKRWGMCASIKRQFDRIAQKYREKYPDLGPASECYDALDEIKGCAGDDPRPRARCGYPPLVRTYRSPGPGGDVIVSTPSKADLGKDGDIVDMHLYRIPGALLTGNKDVEILAGKSVDQVKASEIWKTPAKFELYYPALLNEITLQTRERLAEYRAYTSKGPHEAFRLKFEKALRSCGDVSKNAAFMAARLEACRAIAQDPRTCDPAARPATGTPAGSGAAEPGR
jgi:hypothetical protein